MKPKQVVHSCMNVAECLKTEEIYGQKNQRSFFVTGKVEG